MTDKLLATATLVMSVTFCAWAQSDSSVPLYSVTVVDRTVSAVNYQYRNGPTMIDFRGTVLLPGAKGEAVVESKPGRTEVDAKFDDLAPPTRYGREYLTYVLWAITPEGHAKNLGEILPGSSDKAHLRVTTDLQVFGLIVTAEPYSAVRQPSDVVVIENEVRPDTIGRTEPIQAKYELLPRGHYTYHVPENLVTAEGNGPKLSGNEYQQVVELYQAENAVGIAQAAGAAQYAPDIFSKAQTLLAEAREAHVRHGGVTRVVSIARDAAQTAEDARILAIQRRQVSELAAERQRADRAEALRAQAEAAAQTAQTEAAATRALLDQERAARQQELAQPAPAYAPVAPPPAPVEPPPPPEPDLHHQTELRMQLFQQLNGMLPSLDTPRGLVVTVADTNFQDAAPRDGVFRKLAGVAQILSAQRGLLIEIDGYGPFCEQRANAVAELLVHDGVPQSAITARGLGDSRPLVSDASAGGREENHRLEIVITGAPIGPMPYWAKSYKLLVHK